MVSQLPLVATGENKREIYLWLVGEATLGDALLPQRPLAFSLSAGSRSVMV